MEAVFHMQEIPPQKRFIVGCSSPFMRLAEHFTSRLVQARSAWSVKIRRAPYCRDAMVYGHTTTTMHDNASPPPQSLPLTLMSLSW